ncbi:MAG: hypothetical protein H8D67_19620 [Deltaproteobacteria bacterium]|nr:hypothetical protein [Deltaproteobacteria bacterium]
MRYLKTRTTHWTIYVATGILALFICTGTLLAREEIGSLVFDAMKKIEDEHQTFTNKVKGIRSARKSAVAAKESVKKKYTKTKDGSLDQKEFQAEYTLELARVYRSLYDEAELANGVAGKHLGILNKLAESIESGETELTAEGTMGLIEASKGFLDNGRALFNSLAQYRDKITDPVVHSRLNLAYDTARMLSRFIEQTEKGSINRYSSRKILKQKLAELKEHLKAIYAQTDMFMVMIKDRCLLLRMINQVAASEMAVLSLTGGKNVVASLSKDVLSPLMNILNESDEDLETLTSGVTNGASRPTSGGTQRWTKGDF